MLWTLYCHLLEVYTLGHARIVEMEDWANLRTEENVHLWPAIGVWTFSRYSLPCSFHGEYFWAIYEVQRRPTNYRRRKMAHSSGPTQKHRSPRFKFHKLINAEVYQWMDFLATSLPSSCRTKSILVNHMPLSRSFSAHRLQYRWDSVSYGCVKNTCTFNPGWWRCSLEKRKTIDVKRYIYSDTSRCYRSNRLNEWFDIVLPFPPLAQPYRWTDRHQNGCSWTSSCCAGRIGSCR